MSILFIGKRFYTNRDAYTEKFGRIYQLPFYWSKEKKCQLWLVDYHTKEKIKDRDNNLSIISTPALNFAFIFKILSILIIERPKTIVASGDCYIGLLGFILSKFCFSKFIFDVYDKYDTFSGYKNLGFINLFHFLLKKSDKCLFASRKLQGDFQSICQNTHLVPNGVDTSIFYPRNKKASREFFQLDQNSIYIGYFGSMEEERGIDDLIEAVKLLHKLNNKFKILLGGKKRESLNLDYDFIKYLGNISFHNVPIAMASCDILTLPYRSSEFLDNASSCKIYEYLSMNITIVATKSKNTLNTLDKNTLEKIILCSMNNPSQLVSSIKKHFEHTQSITYENTYSFSWKEISKNILFKN